MANSISYIVLSYGEICTYTFKSKNNNYMNLYIDGMLMDTIYNSDLTVQFNSLKEKSEYLIKVWGLELV